MAATLSPEMVSLLASLLSAPKEAQLQMLAALGHGKSAGKAVPKAAAVAEPAGAFATPPVTPPRGAAAKPSALNSPSSFSVLSDQAPTSEGSSPAASASPASPVLFDSAASNPTSLRRLDSVSSTATTASHLSSISSVLSPRTRRSKTPEDEYILREFDNRLCGHAKKILKKGSEMTQMTNANKGTEPQGEQPTTWDFNRDFKHTHNHVTHTHTHTRREGAPAGN
jgi:hypothetical protein